MDGWMTCHLCPFQQYFSNIRMMGDDNERLCAMEPPFKVGKISVLREDRT